MPPAFARSAAALAEADAALDWAAERLIAERVERRGRDHASIPPAFPPSFAAASCSRSLLARRAAARARRSSACSRRSRPAAPRPWPASNARAARSGASRRARRGAAVKRRATYIICGLDAAAWLAIVAALLLSGSDFATQGLDKAAAAAVTILLAITALPAFLLARAGRAADAALALALGFPGAFLLLLILVVFLVP